MRVTLTLLLLAGCAGSPPESAPARQASNEVRAMLASVEAPFRAPGTVVARLGQTVSVGGVSIRPLRIEDDSRCPIDVDCAWAGRILVRVAVGGVGEPVMQMGRAMPLPGGRALLLAAVAPPRWSRVPPGVDPNAPPRFAFRFVDAR